MPDWKKIKAEYIRDKVSYRKLAEKYGVSPSTVYRRMRKEKWADLRKQSEAKANARIVDSVASQEAKRVDTYNRISDKLLQKIEDGIEDGSLILTCKGLSDLSTAIKNLRDIHGLKADADLREQEARIEKLRKEAQTEDDNKDIHVVIAGGLEDYAE